MKNDQLKHLFNEAVSNKKTNKTLFYERMNIIGGVQLNEVDYNTLHSNSRSMNDRMDDVFAEFNNKKFTLQSKRGEHKLNLTSTVNIPTNAQSGDENGDANYSYSFTLNLGVNSYDPEFYVNLYDNIKNEKVFNIHNSIDLYVVPDEILDFILGFVRKATNYVSLESGLEEYIINHFNSATGNGQPSGLHEGGIESPTFIKLIKSAERDGHINPHEGSAQYIMDAAKEIGREWDQLHPEEQKVYRDKYYRKFLKKIGKI
jgi:hypothetical protein